MKITFKCTDQQYVVTVNGHPYTFASSKDACEFIFSLRKAA
jgi:hypothetical protein